MVVTATRTRTGSNLPKWREIIEQGGNATTGLTAQWDSVECDKADLWIIEESTSSNPNIYYKRSTTHSGYIPVINYGAGCAQLASPTLSSAAAENRASATFYKKLRGLQVIMSGPTFLGELRETVRMLRRPAAALYSKANGYLDALHHAKRASPKHWTKTLSGLWLEHSFGWKPLINDTLDAAKAYRSLGKPRQAVISAGATDFKDMTSTLSWGNGIYAVGHSSIPGAHKSCRARSKAWDRVIVRYKGKLKAQVEMAEWDNWDAFGFTPSEFVPTAWELLPWSFLVDYFTNVGDILTASVTSTANVAFVNKTVIRDRLHVGNVSPELGPVAGAKVSQGGSASFKLRRRLVTRTAGVGVPFPTLRFETGLSDGQLFNVAALLGQARALHGQNTPRNWHR